MTPPKPYCGRMSEPSTSASAAAASDTTASRISCDTSDSESDSNIRSRSTSQDQTSRSRSATMSPPTVEVVSLLSRLKSPTPSDLSRKRKTATNPPLRGKRRSRGSTSAEPKSIQPHQRVQQFPSEPLRVKTENKRLFCEACREELSLKHSVLCNHMKSTKHIEGKKRLESKVAREKSIAEALKKHNEESHLRGETLPDSQQVYRVKVVTCFLRAAVPLRKLDCFRELLEEHAYRLSDRRHLSDLIPFIHSEEELKIRGEISGRPVSVIFDGTTRLGEALAIVLRFVSDEWSLEQRLVRLQLLAKSLSGEEIARELISVLSVAYSIDSNRLLSCMRDRAATNGVAVRTLKIVYPNLLDVGCFSHTLDRVGEHFIVPILSEFITLWVSMFSHSPKARLLWKEQTGRAMGSYSATRWWSKWEIMQQLMIQYPEIEQFLRNNPEVAPASHAKLSVFFQDKQKNAYLQLELAAIIDWGEHFVKATYNLEGDGPLVLQCYEIIDAIVAAIRLAHTPNVRAVAHKLVGQLRRTTLQQLLTYAKNCIQPGLDYFTQQLDTSLKIPLEAFKAARLFHPPKVYSMKPTACDVDDLRKFPFLNSQGIVDQLKGELPLYI